MNIEIKTIKRKKVNHAFLTTNDVWDTPGVYNCYLSPRDESTSKLIVQKNGRFIVRLYTDGQTLESQEQKMSDAWKFLLSDEEVVLKFSN